MLFKMIFDFLRKIPLFIILAIVAVVSFAAFNSGFIGNIVSSATGSTKSGSPDQSSSLISNIIQQVFLKQTPSVAPTPTPWAQNITITITQGNTPFIYKTEVADTPQKQQIGLMYRASLPEYNAMLFPFDSPQVGPFWMKNVEFPLDMLFLDKDLKIVDIIKNVPQCKKVDPSQANCPYYTPKRAYSYTIEILGGSVDKLGITEAAEIKITQ